MANRLSPNLISKFKFRFNPEISLNQLTALIIFFVIGLYGYPSVSLDYKSNLGMIVRTLALTAILFLVCLWILSINKLCKRDKVKSNVLKLAIDYTDVLKVAVIFMLIVIFKKKELSSTITGDEISLYGNSIQISVLTLDFISHQTTLFDAIPARFMLAIIQLFQIVLGVISFIYLRKKSVKYKLIAYLLTISTLFSLRNLLQVGTYTYPNAEVLPYYFLSPITLSLNVNPRLIPYLIFAVFLLTIYNLAKNFTKSIILSSILILLFISIPMTSDITTSINHAVYYVYFLTYLMVRIIFKLTISANLQLILLLASILRPTLLPILILFFLVPLFRQVKVVGVSRLLWNYGFVFSSIVLVHGIIGVNKLVDFAFGIGANNPQANTSISYRLSTLLESLSQLDAVTAGILTLFFVINFVQKDFFFPGILFISVFMFAITAPAENLQVPIYKTEILLPFVFLAYAKVFLLILLFFSKLSRKRIYVVGSWGGLGCALIILNTVYLHNYNFSGVSWSERFKYDRSNVGEFYITYGKVNYKKVVTRLSEDLSSCKFLDVTYDGTFLLSSNISSREFVAKSKFLNIDLESLTKSNLGQCVIVGNYSLNHLYSHLSNEGLGLELLVNEKDHVLGTTIYAFKTKLLG